MIKALSLCEHLADRLRNLTGTSLKLHSMFDQSANFMAADGHIISFLAEQIPMAVSSIQLPASNIREFFGSSQELLVNETFLQGRTIMIHFKDARPISPLIQDHNALQNGSRLMEPIKQALLSRIPEGGIYQEIADCKMLGLPSFSDRPANPKYAMRFERFIEGLTNGDPALIKETVKGIVGYGIGLTPSADDFIIGVLAACSDSGACFVPLAAACTENLSRTTTISAEMLYHGSEKRFSQSIVQLFSGSDPDQALADLLGHGHSSGHDTLCGIYAGLTALSKSSEGQI